MLEAVACCGSSEQWQRRALEVSETSICLPWQLRRPWEHEKLLTRPGVFQARGRPGTEELGETGERWAAVTARAAEAGAQHPGLSGGMTTPCRARSG